ncbi:hypothetical protein ACJMK2_007623 [Sinanodonta woodiana]|uniref:EamA domain-containing protein n=1 Tax=Sinanodonta woodiana TaxID=1069815 RepID=A0ABD3VJB2_SINWO
MAWTTRQITLAVAMVITGSLNTLSTKWADNYSAESQDGVLRPFNHPFLQAVGMFLGEMSCLLAFHLIRLYNHYKKQQMDIGNQSFSPLIFLPAACCDMVGTSLMYIGLNLTYASSFQMLRGAVIIFTALLSVAFLGRMIKPVMWAGMVMVTIGLAVVGVADIVFGDNTSTTDTNGIIAGDLLIVMAQVIVGVQMVYEEKFINKHNVPALQAVGWEGVFGFFILGLLLIPFYYINAGTFSNTLGNRLENAPDAFVQMGNKWQIIVATVGNIVSIAFFNFAGISVTKEISATTRMVLDSIRTLIIWVVSLSVAWQKFQGLQVLGFIMLISGTCLYNELIIMPAIRAVREKWRQRGDGKHRDEEREHLTSNQPEVQVANYGTGEQFQNPAVI